MKEAKTGVPRPRGVFILLACLTAGVAASVALGVVALVRSNRAAAIAQAAAAAAAPAETQENDVVIDDSYVIRATTQISDAYKSGDASALSDKDRETLDMASAVLSEILTDGMSNYEKEKAVYDWMTHNLQTDAGLTTVIPTTQADCDNPYGVLKYHDAVCVGYATTFRLFMQMMDIPCMVVHNTAAYHSWDLVQLDGDWYHTDIYSDVGTGNYANFNMNDTLCKASHDWDTDFFPAADSLKDNLLYQTAADAGSVYDLPASLRAAMNGGATYLALKYDGNFSESDTQIGEDMLNQISSALSASAQYQNLFMTWSWCPLDNGALLIVSLYDETAEPTEQPSLDEAAQAQADAAVTAAFGDLAPAGGWSESDTQEGASADGTMG